ncbi:MAG: hypothetical protein WDO24_29495 [Pseudomonadota bacterium]
MRADQGIHDPAGDASQAAGAPGNPAARHHHPAAAAGPTGSARADRTARPSVETDELSTPTPPGEVVVGVPLPNESTEPAEPPTLTIRAGTHVAILLPLSGPRRRGRPRVARCRRARGIRFRR